MLGAALLLAATLQVSPERAVHPPVRDAQPYEQIFGDVAGGDETALVVWRDSYYELRAARVDRDGGTVDAVPLTIASEGAGTASAARGLDGWLVVWTYAGGIASRLVRDDGTLGRTETIAVPELQSVVHVAFDGESFLVVWREGTQFAGARFRPSGVLLESGFAIAAANDRHPGALLADDFGFVLVAWRHAIDVMRLDSSGRPRSSTRIDSPVDLRHVVAGFDAAGELVVSWLDGDDIHVKRGNASPQLLVRGTSSLYNAPRSVIAAGGATFALFQRGGDVVLKELDTGAERVWDVAYASMNTGAVSFGDRVLVAAATMPPPVQEGISEQRGDLYVTVVDASMTDVEPVRLLYVEPRLRFRPAIAGDVTVWLESADEERQKRLLAKIGRGAPLVVAEHASPIGKPRVATSGDAFVVMWLGHDLRPWTRHVRRDGTMGEPLPISQERVSFNLLCFTWTGTEYVAAFVVQRATGGWFPITEVWAQPLTRDGAIGGPAVQLAERGPFYFGVTCASSETATLFAWDGAGIRGALREHTGAVTGPIQIGIGEKPTIASNGTTFLVAWAFARAIVSASGTPGTPIPTPADVVTAAVRDGEYMLLTETSGTLTATPLDANGAAAGEPVVLAHDATGAEMSGSTVIYQRDTASLFLPRWQVFLRDLGEGGRRRAVR